MHHYRPKQISTCSTINVILVFLHLSFTHTPNTPISDVRQAAKDFEPWTTAGRDTPLTLHLAPAESICSKSLIPTYLCVCFSYRFSEINRLHKTSFTNPQTPSLHSSALPQRNFWHGGGDSQVEETHLQNIWHLMLMNTYL